MKTPPSAAEVRAALAPLVDHQMRRLAALSGVSVSTLYKVKRGEVVNPGIDTVGKFSPHLRACRGRK
jgi:transcriptional regulator with XRE-family HTH domain